ncbi:MAG: hypothetical protein JWR69_1018, partial [Pedosphaera sp.]|nr:hypothetical protein [Pedosphaera sp.]
NGVMLNFQGPGPQWMGGATLPPGYEAEWAEMIASLLIYARNTRHLQFSLVGPDNEPDNINQGVDVVNAAQYVTMLHLLAQKLDTNGSSDLRFVGPDRAGGGTNFMPEMMNDPVVMGKMAHFGVHGYSGSGTGSTGVRAFINQSGFQDRTLWMTEFNVWCPSCESGDGNTNDWSYFRGTAEYLLGHLANGASAGMVWDGYDSFYTLRNLGWTYWGLFAVDDTNAVPKTYTPRKNFYTLAQIARFVRPGAQQIGLSGSLGSLMAQAFYHKVSGQLTLTGVNPGNATTLSGTLASLPAVGSLEFYCTSSSTNLYHSAPVMITNGAFTASIPADCVFTLTGFDPGKTAVSVAITNPVDGARFAAPATISISASVSTSAGSHSTVAFFNGATKLAGTNVPPYSMIWSNVGPGDHVLTARATNSLGNSAVSAGVHVVVVGPLAQIEVLPTNAMVIPYGAQQFTVIGKDAQGNPLLSQPAFGWSVNGGGTINSNGWFTAGGSVGGPFTISATNGSLSDTASVSVVTNLNLAPNGTGYTWYNLGTSSNNTPQVATPGVNDGDLVTDVPLTPDGAWDTHGAYEAAGVIWSAPQTFSKVVYRNGSYTPGEDGVFAANSCNFHRMVWCGLMPERNGCSRRLTPITRPPPPG